jgi:hypothetical protein
VPVISTFFGIVIRMFYREHGVGHFHAEYRASWRRSPLTGNCSLAGFVPARLSASSKNGQYCIEQNSK